MKLRILLPALYIVGGMCLLFFFGGTGHGWGIAAFYLISLPASLLISGGNWAIVAVLFAGIAQYTLNGYFLDRIVGKA